MVREISVQTANEAMKITW